MKVDWDKNNRRKKEHKANDESYELYRLGRQFQKQNQLATGKQIQYLVSLGIDVPKNCTIKQAGELIEMKVKRKKPKWLCKQERDNERKFFKNAAEADLSGEWLKNNKPRKV